MILQMRRRASGEDAALFEGGTWSSGQPGTVT